MPHPHSYRYTSVTCEETEAICPNSLNFISPDSNVHSYQVGSRIYDLTTKAGCQVPDVCPYISSQNPHPLQALPSSCQHLLKRQLQHGNKQSCFGTWVEVEGV